MASSYVEDLGESYECDCYYFLKFYQSPLKCPLLGWEVSVIDFYQVCITESFTPYWR
jgi:hypothetical protein